MVSLSDQDSNRESKLSLTIAAPSEKGPLRAKDSEAIPVSLDLSEEGDIGVEARIDSIMEEPVRLDEDGFVGVGQRQTSISVVTRSHEDSPVKNNSKIITTTHGVLTPALQTSEIGKASLAGHTAIEFNS